eukprot:1924436-Pleurochrysis_carterae.AAC.1
MSVTLSNPGHGQVADVLLSGLEAMALHARTMRAQSTNGASEHAPGMAEPAVASRVNRFVGASTGRAQVASAAAGTPTDAAAPHRTLRWAMARDACMDFARTRSANFDMKMIAKGR